MQGVREEAILDLKPIKEKHGLMLKNVFLRYFLLKVFSSFWEFSFYGQKKVADYEYHSLFAEKIHFHT